MSFFEKARTGYEQLAGRADGVFDSATASKELGEIDQHYRDLGMLAYLEVTGRPVDESARERILGVLHAMEERGAIRAFPLNTAGGAPAEGVPTPDREGGSDGVPQPPPERAGRHGGFLSQPRQDAPPPPPSTWASSGPDETTGPRPTPPPPPPPAGGTWGPPPR